MHPWSEKDIPDQRGRTAVVTGSTSGLGLRVAEVLANRGARVIITARDAERGARALARVSDAASGEPPELVTLDLADLESVSAAADAIKARSGDRIDLLVNNAGIMAPPLTYSRDGIELQWATNVFGPAALTRLLLPIIEPVPGGRIVHVSSLAHFAGRLDADRIDADISGQHYRRFSVYGRTKLANLLMTRHLERHFRRVGAETISLAAHPGLTATAIAGTVVADRPAAIRRGVVRAYGIATQPERDGALPLLYAATEPAARAGQYYGPRGLFETRGAPAKAARSPSSRSDRADAAVESAIVEMTGLVLSGAALTR